MEAHGCISVTVKERVKKKMQRRKRRIVEEERLWG